MDLGLKDKVAVITGASRGIGLAVARGLAAEGARLALCGRDEARTKAVAAEITAQYGVRCIGSWADVGRSGASQPHRNWQTPRYSSAHRAPATASAAPTAWMAAG